MAESTKGGGFRASTIRLRGGAGCSISSFTGTIDTSGTDATWAGTDRALPGSLLINLTTLKIYINTNTKASPTWTVVGAQS